MDYLYSKLRFRKVRPPSSPEAFRDGHTVRQAVFGPRSRYCLKQFLARADETGTRALGWIVTDAETLDTVTGGPAAIRQSHCALTALKGLES